MTVRIAILGPIAWRTPPRHYGGWETVVSNLTEGLVARGYDVTLFATGDSITRAKLAWVCPRPYEEDKSLDPKVWSALHIAHCFERAHEFDLIHNHFDFLPLTYTRLVDTPVVTTIHGFSSPDILPVYQVYNDRVAYVSISDADRHPSLRYVATVYNGIDLNQFTFNPEGGETLVYLGRIHPEKGVHLAIEVARRTGHRLVIAGIVQDVDYFQHDIAPHLDGEQIRFVGPVGPRARDELLGNALATLHLVTRPERFGLSIVESLACGTPVIAMDLGSPREILTAGTGFLVKSVDEAVEAVRHVREVDRRACRRRARDFSVERMVDGYVRVYEQVLNGTWKLQEEGVREHAPAG